MHTHTITPKNTDASSPFFNKYLADTWTDYIATSYTDTSVNITFTQNQQAADYTTIEDYYNALDITDILPETALQAIYDYLVSEGFKWSHGLITDLIQEFQVTTISLADALYIEEKLIDVIDFVHDGDWAAGLIEITDNVVIAQTVSQTDIDNEYTQARHDAYIAEIQAFIDANY